MVASQVSIVVGIMSHPSRESITRMLQEETKAEVVVTDHRGLGENANGNLTWRLLSKSNAEWAIVLQDDALVVDDFRHHAAAALDVVGDGLVSFYTGTGRPRQPEVIGALARAEERGLAWLQGPELFWGVGVAMRVSEIPDYIEWSERAGHWAYDRRIGQWFARRGKPIYYTNPSLVEHRDLPSLVYAQGDRKPPPPRHAHNFGVPQKPWHTAAQRIPEPGARFS